MGLAATLSGRVTGLKVGDIGRLVALVEKARLPLRAPPQPYERWIELMSRDKKVESGAMRFVLLDALGRAAIRADVDAADLRAVLK
jgi:3-dehydroquinate synthase